MKKLNWLCIVICLFIVSSAFASSSKEKLWQKISETNIPASVGERRIIPDAYGTFRLNVNLLQAQFSKAGAQIVLPYPDGSFKRFHIESSPVMEPALAARFPEFQTFNGKGIDEPTATAKLDWTSHGFHAMIFSTHGTLLIDPYRTKDVLHYISYYKKDYHPAKRFQCLVLDSFPHSESSTPQGGTPVTLRTYRLAVGATGEYTQFHGGTVNDGLAAITTSLNRINGIYEREFAVHMNLVANETSVIFTDPATDPYSDGNGGAMIDENQDTMDSIIGDANYDIAHAFGAAGGGGLAGLGVVCASGVKAWGISSLSPPEGDTYDVDYVSHEMGHQFSGNHSFNGTTGACNGNRNSSTAWEVGSGSTIMSYAGICGTEDLQPHSDDYFHTGNFSEIFNFVSSGGGSACAQLTPAGHSTPTSDAGTNYTIPQSTPFVLTGSGSDPDGDSLTYNWEEFDLGAASPPNGDNGNRPIFRSFEAVAVPYRTFPQLSDILNNTMTFGEFPATTNRTMNFKLSVRDNHPGAGGQGIDTTQVTVAAAAGPFLVTQPNTAVTWNPGTLEEVTWDVAGTTGPPVSASIVHILLSSDGGNTFSYVLAQNTANDGSEMITVPAIPTTMARVKVEAVGNIFFDISNADFTITGNVCLFCDDFEDGILDLNWTYVKPAWSESGGNLIGTPAKRKAIAIATPVFAGCTNCYVEAQMQSAGGFSNKVWLLGWYQDKNNTVELLMKEENDRWVLKQRSGGAIVAKGKILQTIDPNVGYVARIAYDGTNFQVTIDGVLLLSLPAGAPASGTIGFQSKNTTGSFGYIQVN
jgi:hypothetical protein